jgi:hypothetical protein
LLALAAVVLFVAGTFAHAHAVFKHLREPHPPFSQTPDIYWNTSYYTPTGRRLVRLALWGMYPMALLLLALQLAYVL